MPNGRPMIASASSTDRPRSNAAWIAAWIHMPPMRLAMKPGVSLAWITCLPSFTSQNSSMAAMASLLVFGPVTISNSRM